MPLNIASAGNVLYKQMKFRCSMRIPPGLSSKYVVDTLKTKLEAPGDETFGAVIEFTLIDGNDGFDAPDLPPFLKTCLESATRDVFG
jgi:acetylornithine deacetylase/succinyl-diaminopimelate desuccinylase-like protein